jgi:hypothetical protein
MDNLRQLGVGRWLLPQVWSSWCGPWSQPHPCSSSILLLIPAGKVSMPTWYCFIIPTFFKSFLLWLRMFLGILLSFYWACLVHYNRTAEVSFLGKMAAKLHLPHDPHNWPLKTGVKIWSCDKGATRSRMEDTARRGEEGGHAPILSCGCSG